MIKKLSIEIYSGLARLLPIKWLGLREGVIKKSVIKNQKKFFNEVKAAIEDPNNGWKKNMKAISIKQPWAHLILTGKKPLENRTWSTKERGRILIHASKKIDVEAMKLFGITDHLPTGCILGSVEIIDSIPSNHPDIVNNEWNQYHGWCWSLKNPEKLTPFKYKGQLRFFEVDMKKVLK